MGGDGQRLAVTGRHEAAERATVPTSLGEKYDSRGASWGRNRVGRTMARWKGKFVATAACEVVVQMANDAANEAVDAATHEAP